jgi:hypothetical protein
VEFVPDGLGQLLDHDHGSITATVRATAPRMVRMPWGQTSSAMASRKCAQASSGATVASV